MMWPPRRFFMSGITSLIMRMTPKKLVSNTFFISSMGMLSTGPTRPMPALLTAQETEASGAAFELKTLQSGLTNTWLTHWGRPRGDLWCRWCTASPTRRCRRPEQPEKGFSRRRPQQLPAACPYVSDHAWLRWLWSRVSSSKRNGAFSITIILCTQH